MGGLFKQLYNVLKVEWSDNVNSINDTFVFYRSKQIHDTAYYFMTSEQQNITIDWNSSMRSFNVVDSQTIEVFSVTAIELMERFKKFEKHKNSSTDWGSALLYFQWHNDTTERKYNSDFPIKIGVDTIQELFKLK